MSIKAGQLPEYFRPLYFVPGGFLIAWTKVKTPEGDDILRWAVDQAEQRPYTAVPCLGKVHKAVMGAAYHLSLANGDEPILLPGERLGPMLGVSYKTVYRAITLLRVQGVLKLVKLYEYAKQEASEYLFVGPPMPARDAA